jgi:DNA-binding transcriptional LysR family regulator
MAPPTQPDLIRRPLLGMRHRVFASPTYLKDYGTPTTLEELDTHQIIAYDDSFHPPYTEINWLMYAGREEGAPHREPVLRVNNIYAMFRAAASGLGIASLPDYMGQLAHDLVPILPKHEGPAYDVFLVYPEELRHSQRIVAFKDFLIRSISTKRK